MILIGLGVLCLINLVLVLRILARIKANEHSHSDGMPLPIGSPAPAFHALTLAGKGMTDAMLAGHPILFVFVSPNCDACRSVIGRLPDLDGVQTVLVTDVGPERTRSWLADVDREDQIQITVPVLAAPASRSPMIADFDPPGLLPYFCLIDAEHLVVARGHVGGQDWKDTVGAKSVAT
jgi:hypothetical protein